MAIESLGGEKEDSRLGIQETLATPPCRTRHPESATSFDIRKSPASEKYPHYNNQELKSLHSHLIVNSQKKNKSQWTRHHPHLDNVSCAKSPPNFLISLEIDCTGVMC